MKTLVKAMGSGGHAGQLTAYGLPRASAKLAGYAINHDATIANLTKIKDPANFIVLFETNALGRSVIANMNAQTRDRHKGVSVVGRADSSARFVRSDLGG